MTFIGLARPIYPPSRSSINGALRTPALPSVSLSTPPWPASGVQLPQRAGSFRSDSPATSLTAPPNYRPRPRVESRGYHTVLTTDHDDRHKISAPPSLRRTIWAAKDAPAAAITLPSGASVPQWSLPQAKAILTTWTILASLLASTSTSLLSFFRASSNIAPVVPALIYAAIGLEIWGAVVAAGTMVAGISMESACQDRHRLCMPLLHRRRDDETSEPWHVFDDGSADSTSRRSSYLRDMEASPLSPLALRVLDNLTLTCGYLIPLAALLELTALLVHAYSLPRKRVGAADEAVAITLALAIGAATTVGAIVAGYWQFDPSAKVGLRANGLPTLRSEEE